MVDILAFAFLDPPAPALLIEALQELYWLDAIDANGRITSNGRLMARFNNPALRRRRI